MTMNQTSADKIQSTWDEIGIKARPLRNTVFIRTEKLPEYVGRIFIPPSQRGNYSGLAHTVFLRSIVLSAGPDCKTVKVGDLVTFPRLFFARWREMDDGTLVGWVQESNIFAEYGDQVEGVPL